MASLPDLCSGISSDRHASAELGNIVPADEIMAQRNDVKAFFVGEAFMRADDPGAALSALFG